MSVNIFNTYNYSYYMLIATFNIITPHINHQLLVIVNVGRSVDKQVSN